MGLAASQARLLTITARLADNELRSQTINNAKMRLATQSAQASDEYVSALNNAQMMFSNVGTDGLTQKQALTFNALTQYSQYNTQYGIVNSAGMIMVSEEDAAIFKNTSNNLEGFLKAHGLEWETTFFKDDSLQSKLQSFYSNDSTEYIANLLSQSYNNKSGSEALKERYLDSLSQDASIENLNYQMLAQNYYQQAIQLYQNTIPEFRSDLLGESEDSVKESTVIDAISSRWNDAYSIREEVLKGMTNPGGARGVDGSMGSTPAAYAFNNVMQYLSQQGKDDIGFLISSLRDEVFPGTGTPTAGYQCDMGTFEPSDRTLELPVYDMSGNQTGTQTENAKVYKCHHVTIVIGGLVPTGFADEPTNHKPTGYTTGNYIQVDRDSGGGWNYGGTSDLFDKEYKQQIGAAPSDPTALERFLAQEISKVKEKMGDYYHSFQISTDPITNQPDYSQISILNIYDIPRGDAYHAFLTKYFDMLLDCEGYFDAEEYAEHNSDIPTLDTYNTAVDQYVAEYGFKPASYEYLIDFEKLIKSGTYGSTDSFNSVLNSWLVNKMLDVLGEPKYAWVDKNDPANIGNADAKAQWLTNLFNRMQKGYKVLENGLAKSQEWLEYAFESGLVSMEQVDLSYNWVSMDYKSCSNIYEETDNSSTVSKAEAKYNRAMNDIKQKDGMFDLQLKNIDTEHSALQTEYDVIKEVMKKNIERTMKFDQNG